MMKGQPPVQSTNTPQYIKQPAQQQLESQKEHTHTHAELIRLLVRTIPITAALGCLLVERRKMTQPFSAADSNTVE